MSVVNGNTSSPRVPVYSSACARCLTALVRDSGFERTPCVRRRACLFVNSDGEKWKEGRGGGQRGMLQYLMKEEKEEEKGGHSRKKNPLV